MFNEIRPTGSIKNIEKTARRIRTLKLGLEGLRAMALAVIYPFVATEEYINVMAECACFKIQSSHVLVGQGLSMAF